MPPTPRETPEVSFVLTVFNKAWAIPTVWDRLKRQKGGPFEFVVVDDCSTDGSQTMLSVIAREDPRLHPIFGERNVGPAVRLNQGAHEARGRFLYLIDGDDLAPVNGAAWARHALSQARAALIWGRRRKDAPESVAGTVSEKRDALAFAASRPVVHMAGMVERALFLRAGGADERVFIQDQSTPLRLARAAGRMLWTEVTLAGAQSGPASLSTNKVQQHHDRYLSARNLLADGVDGAGAEALRRLCVSAIWKARRHSGTRPAFLSPTFGRYLGSRAGIWRPDVAMLDRYAAGLLAAEGIRRPEQASV